MKTVEVTTPSLPAARRMNPAQTLLGASTGACRRPASPHVEARLQESLTLLPNVWVHQARVMNFWPMRNEDASTWGRCLPERSLLFKGDLRLSTFLLTLGFINCRKVLNSHGPPGIMRMGRLWRRAKRIRKKLNQREVIEQLN